MESQTNLLTLGIPFYKNSNPTHLSEAILSILNQSLLPEKIHLIQDGDVCSELDSIVNKYKQDFPDLIKIIALPKKGLPYALNQSIIDCDTKYYARMDSDDISFKDRIKKQVDFLEENNDIDILGAWAIEFENDYETEKGFINKRPNDKTKIQEYFHYMNPLIHSTVVFRKNIFDKIGFYNENFITDQDLELWSRALKSDLQIYNIQEPLIYFRVKGRLQRRSQMMAIKRQIIARYSYNTFSFKLNLLKVSAIIFRLLPRYFKEWGYKNLRG